MMRWCALYTTLTFLHIIYCLQDNYQPNIRDISNAVQIENGVKYIVGNFRKFEYRYLDIGPIVPVKALENESNKTLARQCGEFCIITPGCFSFNVKIGVIESSCEILGVDLHSNPCYLKWMDIATHYAVKSACTENAFICEDPSTKCIPIYSNNSFTCEPKPTRQIENPHESSDIIGANCIRFHKDLPAAIIILNNGWELRTWDAYRIGRFGDDYPYLIGNEKLHQLTRHKYHKLIFTVTLQGHAAKFSCYLKIASELDDYRLLVKDCVTVSGPYNASDPSGGLLYQNGQGFSTVDHGRLKSAASKCGWWYRTDGTEFPHIYYGEEVLHLHVTF